MYCHQYFPATALLENGSIPKVLYIFTLLKSNVWSAKSSSPKHEMLLFGAEHDGNKCCELFCALLVPG